MSKLTSSSPLIHFYILSLSLLLLQVASQQVLYDQEQQILLELKQFWKSPPSLNHWTPSNSSNTTTTSHCSWPEITCTNNSVNGILLLDQNITGTIPPFICDLKNLTTLNLTLNYIPGNFPTVLYNCSKLESLDLSQNCFVGPIPDDIDRLVNLKTLNLGANNFSGDIPMAIGSLKMLQSLYLFSNSFNGTFPPEIGNLSNLEELELAYNGFLPQALPESFTQLKNLRFLWMSDSNLIGEIPEMIGNMTALDYLDLSTNSLSGNIPASLFTLKNLTVLYLYKNKLSGEIPQVVEALNMEIMDLSSNNLTGRIPADFGKLEKLSGLAMFSNQLFGEIPQRIGQIPTLVDIKLFNNSLSGFLPPDFGRYSKLERFEIGSNNLTGGLPEYLCAGGVLLGVTAFDNNLSGELPQSLGNCSSLLAVMIYGNQFSGLIPDGLWSLPSLEKLMISDNFFTGELPFALGHNISRLEMNNNQFSGGIPAEISSWRNLIVFEASGNFFTGTIPPTITALPLLMSLLLDRNQFSGSLPMEIISWEKLTTLNLSRNQLSGPIPGKIGFLPVLGELDLSENHFSDQIPPELGHLRLTFLNLSSNDLTGKIPSQLEITAYESSFLNNPGLCSSSPNLQLNVCASQTEKSSKVSTRLLAVILSIVAVICVSALLFAFLLIRVYKQKKHGLDSTWKLTSFQRLNFTESNILSSLTENNIIGSGGSGKVYRVVLNRSGDVVVVKRIWSNRKLEQRLEKEFVAEVQILSTIRHTNIVKLLCCISSDNSKLLVYEYLQNGSLDKWLHNKKRPQIASSLVSHVVLDWRKRLRIAVGAAQGLCYMHHGCSPAIIHRDVKSSNILLDSEFNVKIADFGLAKLLMKPGDINTMSVVAGTFGYIAPEHAHTTRVNEKIDVYSFGVVLLELATGREAHNADDRNTSLAEWAWRHIQDDKPISNALDEEIKEPSNLDEMSNVFKLGIMCTGTLPSTRPSMKEVLEYLLRCSNSLAYGEKNDGKEREYDAAPLLENSKSKKISASADDSLAASNV